jgi:hypothetical protein
MEKEGRKEGREKIDMQGLPDDSNNILASSMTDFQF